MVPSRCTGWHASSSHRFAPKIRSKKRAGTRKLCDLRFRGEARQHKVRARGRYIRAPCIQNPKRDACWCAGRCYNPVRWSLWTEPSAGVCAVLSRKRRIFFFGRPVPPFVPVFWQDFGCRPLDECHGYRARRCGRRMLRLRPLHAAVYESYTVPRGCINEYPAVVGWW